MMLLLLLLTGRPFQENPPPLLELRQLYLQAATKEESAKLLERRLKSTDIDNEPVFVCYKGASRMMQARYSVNPFNKIKYFNSGKILIESAVARDKNNVEMRLLRYSVQSHIPSFLGYNENIDADRTFLTSQTEKIRDTQLKAMVILATAASNKK